MKNKLKYLIYSLSTIFIIFSLFYIVQQLSKPVIYASPEEYIPSDASLIIEINPNFNYSKYKNSESSLMGITPDYHNESINFILSHLTPIIQKSHPEIFKNKPFFLSFHPSSSKYEYLINIPLPRSVKLKNINQLFPNSIPIKIKQIKNPIFKIYINNKTNYYHIENHILTISTNLTILIKSKQAYKTSNNIHTINEYIGLSKTSNQNAPINYFFNIRKNILSTNSFINHLAINTNFDFNINHNHEYITGCFTPSSNQPTIISLSNNSSADVINITKYIPSHVDLLTAIRFDYIENIINSIDQKTATQNDTLNKIDFEYKDFFCNELAFSTIIDSNKAKNYLTCQIIDDSVVQQELTSFSNNNISNYNNHSILSLQTIPQTLHSLFNYIQDTLHYYTIFNKHIVFASSPDHLIEYLYYIDHNYNLNNKKISTLQKYLINKQNIILYQSAQAFNSPKAFIKNNKSYLIQITKDKPYCFFNILSSSQNLDKNDILSIPQEIYHKQKIYIPQIQNSYFLQSKNNSFLFVTTKNNTLFSISKSGKINWTKKLDNTILGDIKVIGYKNNNKTQFIFNTEQFIYIIDENGNYIKNSPIKLKYKTKNEVLTNYFNNTPQYIYCSTNNKICIASNNTTKTSPLPKDVISSSLFLSTPSSNSNFIYLHNNKNNIYIFNKNGKLYKTIKTPFSFSHNSKLHNQNNPNNSSIIVNLNQGKLWEIKQNGNSKNIVLNRFNSDYFFSLSDLNNDRQNEYFFTHDKTLFVYDTKQKLLLKKELQEKIISPPIVISNIKKIISINTHKYNYLIDIKGLIIKKTNNSLLKNIYYQDMNLNKKLEIIEIYQNYIQIYKISI